VVTPQTNNHRDKKIKGSKKKRNRETASVLAWGESSGITVSEGLKDRAHLGVVFGKKKKDIKKNKKNG